MKSFALLLLAGLVAAGTAQANPPADRLAVLRRGVNLTNWFRYPPNGNASPIRSYMSDAAIADLSRAGFTFVRLAVQPEFLLGSPERMGLLAAAIQRLEKSGLGVLVELHPTTWHMETVAADREQLVGVWRLLAPVLARLDPRLTFPEVVNEPVFTGASPAWEALQTRALAAIRADFPAATVVLTGNDWGSLDGLLRLHPVSDGNVVYSFHFYEPMSLTTLADYQPNLDRSAMATLPFPVSASCPPPGNAKGQTLAVMQFYCSGKWSEATIRARMAQAANWATTHHAVVLAGEFGAANQLNAPARLAWLSAVRRALADQGIGWALWGYDDPMGLAVSRPPGDRPRLDPAVLRALGLTASN